MSSRSFADRYRAIARPQVETRTEPTPEPDWPVPEGGVVLDGEIGSTIMFDRLYRGFEIETARELIARAERLPAEARIYIDTETTGLSGGTGTYAFLIGLGWFEPSGFRVRQYFMRHPGEEIALLGYVARHINEFDGLTTFNGRSFDMPLIETRFRMHRLEYAAPGDHLDLLHPARSIWKHRLESCSLGTLEQEILGVVRESDAPGWLIPSIYFNYLRTRAVHDLGPVIEHNRHDICVAGPADRARRRASGRTGHRLASCRPAGGAAGPVACRRRPGNRTSWTVGGIRPFPLHSGSSHFAKPSSRSNGPAILDSSLMSSMRRSSIRSGTSGSLPPRS
ncbi:MAG: ribonuclease H-like domain-containing protein [Thermomicrobiales bacterium]